MRRGTTRASRDGRPQTKLEAPKRFVFHLRALCRGILSLDSRETCYNAPAQAKQQKPAYPLGPRYA